MSELASEKTKLIAEIRQKIEELEEINEDLWTSSKTEALNNIAIAKHYETIAGLLK